MAEEKIKMHINIAGERIPLTVNFDEQNHVRDTERAVDNLFNQWRAKFPKKTEKELLAMIAYQYASYYLTLQGRYDAALREAVRASDAIQRRIDDALAGA